MVRFLAATAFAALAVALPVTAVQAAAPGREGTPSRPEASSAAGLRWFRGERLTEQARALLVAMQSAQQRGLDPRDYAAGALPGAATVPAADVPRIDAGISAAALRLLHDIRQGRIEPSAAGYALDLPRPALDERGALDALASAPDVEAALDAHEPAFAHHGLLRQALARYRELAAAHPDVHALPRLPARSLKAGDSWQAMPRLRALLAVVGDLAPADAAIAAGAGDRLDPRTQDALTRFQARHGLAPDGVLGGATWRALTVPLAQRVRQLELSLERVRWLPLPEPGRPFLLVNIPQFRLFAFHDAVDDEHAMTAMNVVVGSAFPQRKTPVFVARMTHVILRPYWDVPRSIAVREELPRLRGDAGYAARNGFELVRGPADRSPVVPLTDASLDALERGELRLRQRPGPRNALGSIKFMLPNPYNVYLHDTPAQRLFGEARRAYSHGCIRLQDPLALAELVLRGQPGWAAGRIAEEAGMAEGEPLRIDLPQPLTVMIVYATAVATEDGRVLFFEDLYRHDERLSRLLERRAQARPAR